MFNINFLQNYYFFLIFHTPILWFLLPKSQYLCSFMFPVGQENNENGRVHNDIADCFILCKAING